MSVQNPFLHPSFVLKALINKTCLANQRRCQNIDNFAIIIQKQIAKVQDVVKLTQKLSKIKQDLLKSLDQKIYQRRIVQTQIQLIGFYKNKHKKLKRKVSTSNQKSVTINAQQNGLPQINNRLRRRIEQVKTYISRIQRQNHQITLQIKSSQQKQFKQNHIRQKNASYSLKRAKSVQAIQFPTFGQNYFKSKRHQLSDMFRKQYQKIR